MLVFPGSREGRSSSVLVPGLLGLTLCRALAEESHLSALELDEGRELFFFFFFKQEKNPCLYLSFFISLISAPFYPPLPRVAWPL